MSFDIESKKCPKCGGEVTLQEGDSKGYCQKSFHVFTKQEFEKLADPVWMILQTVCDGCGAGLIHKKDGNTIRVIQEDCHNAQAKRYQVTELRERAETAERERDEAKDKLQELMEAAACGFSRLSAQDRAIGEQLRDGYLQDWRDGKQWPTV